MISSVFTLLRSNLYKLPECFRRGIGAHDIAVLKTKKPFVFTKEIKPINLPQPDSNLVKGEALSLSGWGLLRTTMFFPDLPSRLQEVKVTYLTYTGHNPKF